MRFCQVSHFIIFILGSYTAIWQFSSLPCGGKIANRPRPGHILSKNGVLVRCCFPPTAISPRQTYDFRSPKRSPSLRGWWPLHLRLQRRRQRDARSQPRSHPGAAAAIHQCRSHGHLARATAYRPLWIVKARQGSLRIVKDRYGSLRVVKDR